MNTIDKKKDVFLHMLSNINFHRKYYDFYEKTKGNEGYSSCTINDAKEVISTLPIDFKFNKKGNFFLHQRNTEYGEINFKIAVLNESSIELIFHIATKDGNIGAPFHVLAMDVGQLQDPVFEYYPPYPTIPFTNRKELKEAIDFSFRLFEEILQELSEHPLMD